MRGGVLLDRDGTVIEDVGYLSDVRQVRLLPGAASAIKRFNVAGLVVVLVTNQSGVARGLFAENRVRVVHEHLNQLLFREGAQLDGCYYCPHHPGGVVREYAVECGCRKPEPGLLLRAIADHQLDRSISWMVGDKLSDVEAGRRAGLHTALVGPTRVAGLDVLQCGSLDEVADNILAHLGLTRGERSTKE